MEFSQALGIRHFAKLGRVQGARPPLGASGIGYQGFTEAVNESEIRDGQVWTSPSGNRIDLTRMGFDGSGKHPTVGFTGSMRPVGQPRFESLVELK